jgi:phosphohistidine phosphatase
LHKQKIDPNYIFASTKTRAVQTADILAETLGFQGEVIVTPLLNDFSLQSLNNLLQQYPSAEEFAIVGHDPDFSSAVRQLLNLSSCTVTKGCVVTLNIITDQQTLKADMTSLITGGAKTVCNPHKAIAWLQKDHKNMQEGEPKCLIP